MPGYEAKFTHPLLKRHECPICLFAMKNPVQAECGHLFCRDCLEPVLKRCHPICPLDKEKITQEGTFPDNACRREILKLLVNCNHQGCLWEGKIKDLENHLSTCNYRDEQCTQCGQYIQYLNMGAHQSEQCPMRPTTCPHCNKDVPIQQLQDIVDRRVQRRVRDLQGSSSLSYSGSAGVEIPAENCQVLALLRNRSCWRHTTDTRLHQYGVSILRPQQETQEGYEDRRTEIHMNSQELEGVPMAIVVVWKITELIRLRYEERTTCLHSTFFHTPRYRYEAYLRLYVYGDETGRGVFLSLFLVLLRGGSGHQLVQMYPITVSLADEDSGRQLITKSIQPSLIALLCNSILLRDTCVIVLFEGQHIPSDLLLNLTVKIRE